MTTEDRLAAWEPRRVNEIIRLTGRAAVRIFAERAACEVVQTRTGTPSDWLSGMPFLGSKVRRLRVEVLLRLRPGSAPGKK